MPNPEPAHADDLRPIPAVGIVCFKDDTVLLIRRGQPPKKGEWSLPGGRIEPGEPARVAALRELKEETDIDAEILGLVDVVDAIFTNRAGTLLTRHYVLVDYVARWTGGAPQAGDDATEARFFRREDLADLALWQETERIIEMAWSVYQDHSGVG